MMMGFGVQLGAAEEAIKKLEADKRALLDEASSLNEKLKRGSEAIKKLSKEQEKLESKLLKLSSDREAAVAESKTAKEAVKRLEVQLPCTPSRLNCENCSVENSRHSMPIFSVYTAHKGIQKQEVCLAARSCVLFMFRLRVQRDMVELTRCNAKNKQDLEEARTRNSKLEEEVADVRGQLAESQLPPAPTPGGDASPRAQGPGAQKQRLALRDQCTALDARYQEVPPSPANCRCTHWLAGTVPAVQAHLVPQLPCTWLRSGAVDMRQTPMRCTCSDRMLWACGTCPCDARAPAGSTDTCCMRCAGEGPC